MIVCLERLRLENLLTWKSVDWKPNPTVNCLVGANDSGKSNLLRAFEFLSKLAQEPLEKWFAEERAFRAWVTGQETSLRITLDGRHRFAGQDSTFQYSVMLSQPVAGRAPRIEEEILVLGASALRRNRERVTLDSNPAVEVPWNFSLAYLLRNATALNHDIAEQLVSDPFRGLAEDLSRFLRLRLSADAIREPCPVRLGHPHLEASGKNLANGLARIANDPETRPILERIRKSLQQLIPKVCDVGTRVLTDPQGEERVILRFARDTAPHRVYFDADMASDGALFVTALVALSQFPNASGLTLLEEPETGLHPKMLEAVAGMLSSFVTDTGQQILITSHSPVLLDALEPETTWLVVRDEDDHSQISKMADYVELDRWRDNFGSGEIWQTLGETVLTGS